MEDLNLNINWDIDEDALTRSMSNSKKSIENTTQSVEELTQKVDRNMVTFSDSAQEIEDYKKSLQGLSSIKPPTDPLALNDLKSRLAEVKSAKDQLESFYQSGKTNAKEYQTALASLVASEKQLTAEIESRKSASSNNDQSATTASGGQNDALERQKQQLDEVKNKLHQTGAAGKQAFDTVSSSVDAASSEMATNQLMLNKNWQQLNLEAQSYARIVVTSLDPAVIAKYNKLLTETQNEMARIKSMGADLGPGAASKSGWNGLQNSINQISRELPAFTYSAQIGFMAISNNLPILADEISKVRKQNALLTASGEKSVPVWKQLVGTLFSWQTAMSVGIMLMTVYGKEIGAWIQALFKGKNAVEELKRAQEEFNATKLKGAQDAQKELIQLNLLYKAAQNQSLSTKERRRAVTELQKQYPAYFKNLSAENIMLGKTAGAYDKLKNAIVAAARARAYQDKIAELASKRLENEDKVLQKAAESTSLNAEFNTAQSSLNLMSPGSNAYTAQVNRSNAITNKLDSTISDITELNKANAALDKEMKRYESAIENSVLQSGIGVITGDIGGTMGPASKKTLDAYNNLLAEIAELDREYARQRLDDDQQELLALQDKFDKIRAAIQKYNADPENKIKIDVAKIDPIQQSAESNLTYTQGTAKLEKQYEEDYKIYKAYEQLKSDTNKQYADARYKDQLDSINTFESRLQSELSKFDGRELNALEKSRQESLLKIQKERGSDRLAEEDKRMAEMLTLMITYDQKRKKLITEYEKMRIEVLKEGTQEEVAEFDRNHKVKLDELDDSNIQQLASYKKLFEGIERLSDAAARKVISDARIMLTSDTNLSDAERKKIEQMIKDTEKSLNERLPDRIFQLSDAFGQMAFSIGEANAELASMLQGVSNVLNAVVQVDDGIKGLKKGIAGWKAHKASEDKGGILGSVSAIAGIAGPVGQIVGAVSSVVGGVVNFFKASRESAKKAAAEIKKYQDEIIAGELNYNRLLRDRERSWQNINEMTLKELETQKQLLQTQLESKKLRELAIRNPNASVWDMATGRDKTVIEKEMSDYQYALERLQNEGKEITGQRTEKYGGFLGMGKKSRVIDITASLAGKTYEQLEELYESNKMDEAGRKLFEQLRDSKREIEEINETLKEIEEIRLDKMSGGLSASSVSNPILEGLRDGKRGFDDFAQYGEDIIRDALLSAMSATVLEGPIKELVAKFREDAKDGLSEEEMTSFRQAYKEIVQSGIEGMEELQNATGIDFNGKGSTGISGSIQSITQQQADVLAGQVGGIHLAVLRGQELSQKVYEIINGQAGDFRQALLFWQAIAENTSKTATNTGRLEYIENWLEKIYKGNNNSMRAGGN